MTTLLDIEKLNGLDTDEIRARKPFPWLHLEKLITDDGYQTLQDAMPDPESYSRVFGRRRPGRQKPHDRFALQYKRWKSYPEPWQAFIKQLYGPEYRKFVSEMIGRDDFLLHCHWHNTPTGCSVSPHCDAPWKFASHIFYLNTEENWKPEWGGDTVILDDGGKYKHRTAPDFEDFEDEITSPSLGNRSLFFVRTEHSWHGVRELTAPEGPMRKVFIVEVRKTNPVMALRTRLGF